MKLHEIKQRTVADLGIKYKGGSFDCSYNSLTSLEGAPSTVGGDFNCSNNNLTSLEGAPSTVGGDFYCDYNKLTSLEGAPSTVGRSFVCSHNNLTSLIGAPSMVGAAFYCFNNKLTSLKNVHHIIKQINGSFFCRGNPIKDGLLYIMLIKGVKTVSTPFSKADEIINKYLKTHESGSMNSLLEVQELLIDAGIDVP